MTTAWVVVARSTLLQTADEFSRCGGMCLAFCGTLFDHPSSPYTIVYRCGECFES